MGDRWYPLDLINDDLVSRQLRREQELVDKLTYEDQLVRQVRDQALLADQIRELELQRAMGGNRIEEIIRAAGQAQKSIQTLVSSPVWSDLAAKIDATSKYLSDPTVQQSVTSFQLRLSEIALVLPSQDRIDQLAQQAARAVEPFRSGLIAFETWQKTLGARMSAIDSAWALQDRADVSGIGFARLVRLSEATHATSPFQAETGELVAQELGDIISDDESLDPASQDEAAIEAGMAAELLAFPEPTYSGIVIAAGFEFRIPTPMPPETEVPSEVTFDHHNNQIILSVEQHLRKFVEQRLTQVAGAAWLRQRVPNDVRERWRERQDDDRRLGLSTYAPIQYADFMDMHDIISRNDNWREFEPVFLNREDFQISMRRLHPIRKALAHSRPLARAQILTLMSESTRVLTAMAVPVL